MRILFPIFLVLAFSGCASVDQAKYPNVAFGEDWALEKFEFEYPQQTSTEISIEHCVQIHIENHAILIEDASRRQKLSLLAPILLQPFIRPLIDTKKQSVDGSKLIIESSSNRVTAAGRIAHSLESMAPETLAFMLTVTNKNETMSYIYTDLQRMFHTQGDMLPESLSGWIPMTSKNPDRFYIVYSLLEDRANRIQNCLGKKSDQ
jgi:hypothetical protein